MNKISIVILFLICSISNYGQTLDRFRDLRDGKSYKYIKIGNQMWMAENLDFRPEKDRYWVNGGGLCSIAIYGTSYTWEIAKTVCPSGWHLPNIDEWSTLTAHLGGDSLAGGKMKETGTKHWNSPNVNASNSSGFNALAAGCVDGFQEPFYDEKSYGYWWAATPKDSIGAYGISLSNLDGAVHLRPFLKNNGLTVRCIKDGH
jgi:uncharacterized protein (TIGR02145 family)